MKKQCPRRPWFHSIEHLAAIKSENLSLARVDLKVYSLASARIDLAFEVDLCINQRVKGLTRSTRLPACLQRLLCFKAQDGGDLYGIREKERENGWINREKHE